MAVFNQDGYKKTRILPVAIMLIVVAISIAAMISLARIIFFPSGQNSATKIDTSRDSLLSVTEGHSVRMTVRGPIVAEENFRAYQISINPNERKMTTYKGYSEVALDNLSYPNSSVSYEQFVYALDKANLVKGNELPKDKNDIRGICATGRVYQFEVFSNNEVVKNLWTSTCSGSKGSLNASVEQLKNLFSSQIPDYSKKIQGLF